MKKLDKNNIEDILALTPMQEGMLFYYIKAPENEVYLEQLSLEIFGEINIDIFEQAWNFVIETNEMLRAVFRWEKVEHPIQIVLKEHKVQPKFYDISDREANERKRKLEEIKEKDRKSKLNLQEVSSRITLCRMEKNKYEMIISNHHILYDGWSNGIILKEFFNAYNDFSLGKELLKPVKTKFKEFVKWVHQRDIDGQEKAWRNYLEGFDTRTGLSIKRKKGKEVPVSVIEPVQIIFEKETKTQLEGFVRKYKITLASLLYTAWGILLQRYNNTDDVIFGTTVSGRSAKIQRIEEIVGLFINTLPLRVNIQPDEKTKDLLHRIDNESQMREAYEATPMTLIKEYSEIDNNEELFDSIVVIENYPLSAWLRTGSSPLTVDSYSMVEITHYDLTIGVTMGDDIEIAFHYEQKCFEKDAIVRMSSHFRNIVESIVENSNTLTTDIAMISEEEKNMLLYEFNDTHSDYPDDKTIHRLFEEQADKLPDKIALVFENRQLTYRELNERANRLAQVLIKEGVKIDSIIGIMVERSLEMVLAILGILKTGGAYLPIDLQYPEYRVSYMIQDSGITMLLSQSHVLGAKNVRRTCTIIDLDTMEFRDEDGSNLDFPTGSIGDIAYAIYTSGSTGKPKGVLLEHRGIANLSIFHREQFKIAKDDGILQFASNSFDASVWEMCMALLNGAALYLVDTGIIGDFEKFEQFLNKNRITVVTLPPLYANKLSPDHIVSLRLLITAGSAASIDMVNNWKEKVSYVNAYGPTETSICAAVEWVDWQKEILDRVPIGKPIYNTRVFILDSHTNIQPIGVPGELCVSCVGIARGYLNRPGLSAEKFIKPQRYKNIQEKSFPHLTLNFKHLSLYKTGDLARWLPDGRIEFLGRIDHQVKVSGCRIELGEIEDQLLKHKEIKESLVTLQGDSDEKYLCAYIVSDAFPDPSPGIVPDRLREYLSAKLPAFMLPSYFVYLERFPLTPSGKIDRKALPGPQLKRGSEFTAPEGEIENKLADIYANILETTVEQLGMNSNFFQLGGHSLKAMQLVSKIHKEFDVKVPLDQVLKYPTVKGLADLIKGKSKEEFSFINPAEKKEYYALSPHQKRLFILNRMEITGISYNMPKIIELEEEIGGEELTEICQKLIQRHESFRTSFEVLDGQPVQKLHEEVGFEIEYHDLNSRPSLLMEDILRNFVRPFDLSIAPILRVGLAKVERSSRILLFDMHHIIADGVSHGIFARDLKALYRGEELPLLKLQYKDFSQWQNRLFATGKIKEQEEYWINQFAGKMPVLNLPTDYTRPEVQSYEGDRVWFEIAEEETGALKRMALEGEATLFIVLLVLYYILLSKICSQEDIVIGVPAAGRQHEELQEIIGMFVNTLALRNYPRGDKIFREFLIEVKTRTFEAFENQDYQFDDLVKNVSNRRDTSRNPLFDVMFNFQTVNELSEKITEGGRTGTALNLEGFKYENGPAKFDIMLRGVENGGRLFLNIEYRAKLFKKKTIEKFVGYLKVILSSVLRKPGIRLSELEVIPDEIREERLSVFNDELENE